MLLGAALRLVDMEMINCSARGVLQSRTWKISPILLKVILSRFESSSQLYFIPTDISLDLLLRGAKQATVVVQFGKLEPGSAFTQARTPRESVTSDSTPSDTARPKKIKHIGTDRDERLVGHLANRVRRFI